MRHVAPCCTASQRLAARSRYPRIVLRHPPPDLAELSMPELWRRIEAAIDALAPSLRTKIAPPATSDEIDALERSIGRRLPPDYVASLREHAGWLAASSRHGRLYAQTLVAGFTLLPPAVVLVEREFLEGYADQDPGWVPVVRHDEDRALYSCLDLAPSAGESVGRILSICTKDPERRVEWSSFRDLLIGELLVPLERGELDLEALEDEGILAFAEPSSSPHAR